jgi:hypothetical protein
MRVPLARLSRAIAIFSALLALPQTAFSLDLFEGNLGYESDWLHVLDAPAMGDRVYWYTLGDDVTYQFQCAADAEFVDIVLDERGIVPNYIAPDLGPGFCYFRVRETHSSGVTGAWSDVGTLEVIEDREAPQAKILSPVDGQTFASGETISIQLAVSDDTVLHLARFTIGDKYAGTLGLKAENNKLAPSFGKPRTVSFDYTLPKGKKGPLTIFVDVSDVAYRSFTTAVVVNIGKGGSDTQKGNGKNR